MIQSRQIEAFRAVMVTGAMTAAAEAIHVTQPAVSRLIRDLEQELGLALFHRRGNALTPTTAANALLMEVERSFIGMAQIRTFADDLRSGRSASLRIGVLPAMATGFAPRFVAGFCRGQTDLRVMIEGLPSAEIRDQVAAGQLDLGFTTFPFRRDGLSAIPIRDPALVALPAGHRFAEYVAVRARDLHGEQLIRLTRLGGDHGQHPITAALQAVRPIQVIETPHATVACVLVSEGLGVAIVDPFSASEFVGRGVIFRRFEPAFDIGVAAVHSSDRPLSPAAQAFLDAFLEAARQFIDRADYLRP